MSAVPYNKLSDYNFFEGDIKMQNPVFGVLPYEPINTLFTDYAHKNRFIWLPADTKVTFVNENQPFFFPDGSAVIKTFYYDEMLPNHTQKILETRVMIKKQGEWMFATYVWNDAQTEAYLDMEGSEIPITFVENGTTHNAVYRVPNESECFACHKIGETAVLIGPKPRNLNTSFVYEDGTFNQIQKWAQEGYLETSGLPDEISAITNWQDTSKPIEERIRGYLDINCAHCHQYAGYCSYMNVRFAWEVSDDDTNLGICEPVAEPLDGFEYVILPGNARRSAIYERNNSTVTGIEMPLLGRSIVHREAVDLLEEWIEGMPIDNCE